MTHNELLALLNDKSDSNELHALRAVVEIHKPVLHSRYKYICEGCNLVFPCDTIDAIEKELG
jgi:hypothetical protein